MRGGRGFVYRSRSGLAVALANGAARQRRLGVTLDIGAFGDFAPAECVLHVEGAVPRRISPPRRGSALHVDAVLPAYAAGVVTVAPAGKRGR